MAKRTKAQIEEAESYAADLRTRIKPGDRIYTVLRSVSRSGMFRRISLFYMGKEADGTPYLSSLDWACNKFGMGERWGKGEGIGVGGCGMDMGYHLVYNLGRILYPDGFTCPGKGCPSNEHINGDKNYKPHHHRDGGYIFNHKWI